MMNGKPIGEKFSEFFITGLSYLGIHCTLERNWLELITIALQDILAISSQRMRRDVINVPSYLFLSGSIV